MSQYNETPEAYIRRAIDDLSDVEANLFAALNLRSRKLGFPQRSEFIGSHNLKRANTLINEIRQNVETAINKIHNPNLTSKEFSGKSKKIKGKKGKYERRSKSKSDSSK